MLNKVKQMIFLNFENSVFFLYNGNIGLSSIALCKVIALLCFIFGVSTLLLFLIAILIVFTLKSDSFTLHFAIAKERQLLLLQ